MQLRQIVWKLLCVIGQPDGWASELPERDVSPKPLSCFSTFTGLGGMDLGLEAAGFSHIACVEWDATARRSVKANRGDAWNLLSEGDIEAVARGTVPADLGLAPGELDLLSGAPPCQPYSKAGQWVSGARQGLADRRGQYLDDLLLLVGRFLPKVVLLENVRGFVVGRTSALPRIEEALREIERTTGVRYLMEHRVLDAYDFGVPQRRARAIVLLSRVGRPLLWPDPIPPTTAWDAIGAEDFSEPAPPPAGKWTALLPSIPEGQNYLWHTNRGGGLRLFGYRTRYWSFLLKLAKDLPSWTLPAQPGPSTGPFHWDNRPLRVQEMLRLQSFPVDWAVEGTRVEQVRQIGNATPPLLAEALGGAIAAHLAGEAAPRRPSTLVLDAHHPVPPRGEPADVPAEFLRLVANHPDHPGHGLGPGRTAV